MQGYLQQQEVQKLLRAALECSFYISPKEPGLTYDELLRFGDSVDLQPGEIGDAISNITTQYFGKATALLRPNKEAMPLWHLFLFREEPDYRNVEAFDFLYEQFNASARANGKANAKLKHSDIVGSALARNIKETTLRSRLP